MHPFPFSVPQRGSTVRYLEPARGGMHRMHWLGEKSHVTRLYPCGGWCEPLHVAESVRRSFVNAFPKELQAARAVSNVSTLN